MTEVKHHRPQSAYNSHLWNDSSLRPSTSPVVNAAADGEFSTAWLSDSRGSIKLPRAISKLTRPQSTGSYQQRAQAARLLSQTLPPTPDSSFQGGLMIEGCQTGEKVSVEPTSIRRTPSVSSREQAQQVVVMQRRNSREERDRKERLRDKALIKKLEAEVQRLRTTVTEKDDTINALTEAHAKCPHDLEALRLELEGLRKQLANKTKQCDELLKDKHELQHQVQLLTQQRDTERMRIIDYQTANERLNANVLQLQKKLDECETKERQSALTQDSCNRQTDKQLTSLQQQLADQERKHAQLRGEFEGLTQQHGNAQQEARQCRDVVLKYNAFIQKICQPQFSVVKDESLTPVNPAGFNVVEGHVLVPLVLLLEGYALLPTTMRETYNQSNYQPPTARTVAEKRRRSQQT